MSQGDIISICKDAVITALTISAPFLIVSIVIGLVISALQAATQIHEQALTFVPKILAITAILIFLGSWIINHMVDFTQDLYEKIITFM